MMYVFLINYLQSIMGCYAFEQYLIHQQTIMKLLEANFENCPYIFLHPPKCIITMD